MGIFESHSICSDIQFLDSRFHVATNPLQNVIQIARNKQNFAKMIITGDEL